MDEPNMELERFEVRGNGSTWRVDLVIEQPQGMRLEMTRTIETRDGKIDSSALFRDSIDRAIRGLESMRNWQPDQA